MIQTRFLLVLACLVLFTPVRAQSQSSIQLATSDLVAQYVWEESYKALSSPQNNYAIQFLTSNYNGFWPDPTTAFRAQLYVTGNSNYTDSMLNIVYFSDKKNSGKKIIEYSLHWPVMLYHHYLFVGNESRVRAMATETLPEVMGYFEDRKTKRGLLRSPGIWPESLRSGVDYVSMAKNEDAITNAFYYRALVACEMLYQQLGLDATPWRTKAQALKAEFHKAFGQDAKRLFVDSTTSKNASITTNALAICFGLTPESAYPATMDLIRQYGMKCSPAMIPYVVEACLIADEARLAVDLLSFMHDYKQNPAALFLFPQYLFGATPHTPGWDVVNITPRIPEHIALASLSIPVPHGKLSLDYVAVQGLNVTLPLESRVMVNSLEGLNVVVKKYKSHSKEIALTPEQIKVLEQANRAGWVGNDSMIWVDVDTQMLRIVKGNYVEYQARCASAANGVGSQMNSMQTPLGWHSVHSKLGDEAPWGQVFRSRIPTDEIWLPGQDTTEDLVLTRVILLRGEEPGRNQSGQVDSLARHIYIHGTNDEAKIGTPSSHGCIRMTNDDVIDVYQHIVPGMKVLITASEG